MKTIWKFPINLTPSQPVVMPRMAKIICCQIQGESMCLWAIVNQDNKTEIRTIEIVGTGGEVDPDVHRYIGTVQQHQSGQDFVWHVFERINNGN